MRELMITPIDEITFEGVQAFCQHQTAENVRLEYKWEFSSKDSAKQITKEVAAFANTQGGTILYGVAEESDRKPEEKPDGGNLGSDPKAKIQSACVHNVFPPIVPEVSEFLPNPCDSKLGFVVVRVGASEDVHTLDGGRGIYIRANDQSEPIRATFDEILWMNERRTRAKSLQVERRARAVRIMRGVAKAEGAAGDVEVTIGPTLVPEPLVDRSALVDTARRISVPSYFFNQTRVPIDSAFRTRTATDAVVSVSVTSNGQYDWAGYLDIFGNIGLVTRLLEPKEFDSGRLTDEAVELPTRKGKHVGIEVSLAIDRVLCCVRSASALYAEIGFVGLCDLEFHAPSVSGYPLVTTQGRRVWCLGTCLPGDEVRVSETFSTVDLPGDDLSTLEPFVARILWSWGCMDGTAARDVLGLAERRHRGPCS